MISMAGCGLLRSLPPSPGVGALLRSCQWVVVCPAQLHTLLQHPRRQEQLQCDGMFAAAQVEAKKSDTSSEPASWLRQLCQRHRYQPSHRHHALHALAPHIMMQPREDARAVLLEAWRFCAVLQRHYSAAAPVQPAVGPSPSQDEPGAPVGGPAAGGHAHARPLEQQQRQQQQQQPVSSSSSSSGVGDASGGPLRPSGPPPPATSDVHYLGPLSKTHKVLKQVSIANTAIALIAAPMILEWADNISAVSRYGLAGSLVFFGLMTTGALHWITHPYVHELRFTADTQTINVRTTTLLGGQAWHTFNLSDVKPLPWDRPVATFMANNRFYYIDTYSFPDEALLKHLTPDEATVPAGHKDDDDDD